MHKFKNLSQFLEKFPIVCPVTVRWGEMDAFRHVNNITYFKYQEISRLKFFDKLMENIDEKNFDVQGFTRATKIGPIISETYCKFKFSLKYPDKVLIGTAILSGDIFFDRYKLNHTIWSLKHNRVVADGFATVVNYDYELEKPVEISQEMKKSINKVMSQNSIHILTSLQLLNLNKEND